MEHFDVADPPTVDTQDQQEGYAAEYYTSGYSYDPGQDIEFFRKYSSDENPHPHPSVFSVSVSVGSASGFSAGSNGTPARAETGWPTSPRHLPRDTVECPCGRDLSQREGDESVDCKPPEIAMSNSLTASNPKPGALILLCLALLSLPAAWGLPLPLPTNPPPPLGLSTYAPDHNPRDQPSTSGPLLCQTHESKLIYQLPRPPPCKPLPTPRPCLANHPCPLVPHHHQPLSTQDP